MDFSYMHLINTLREKSLIYRKISLLNPNFIIKTYSINSNHFINTPRIIAYSSAELILKLEEWFNSKNYYWNTLHSNPNEINTQDANEFDIFNIYMHIINIDKSLFENTSILTANGKYIQFGIINNNKLI